MLIQIPTPCSFVTIVDLHKQPWCPHCENFTMCHEVAQTPIWWVVVVVGCGGKCPSLAQWIAWSLSTYNMLPQNGHGWTLLSYIHLVIDSYTRFCNKSKWAENSVYASIKPSIVICHDLQMFFAIDTPKKIWIVCTKHGSNFHWFVALWRWGNKVGIMTSLTTNKK